MNLNKVKITRQLPQHIDRLEGRQLALRHARLAKGGDDRAFERLCDTLKAQPSSHVRNIFDLIVKGLMEADELLLAIELQRGDAPDSSPVLLTRSQQEEEQERGR